MTQLTPEQRRQIERLTTRASRIARASFALVFLFLLAAIWLGDWRFAATAVLVLPIGAVAGYMAGRLRRGLARAEEGR